MRPTSKTSRKLALSRTTLRSLQDAELRQAAGGDGGPVPGESGTKQKCDPPIPQLKWQ